MQRQGQQHLLTLLFLALPSAVGMYVLAQPIVEVLFMRGKYFNVADAENTANVVKIYSVLLIALSLTKVLVPNFYAIKNTWLPALTSVISIVFHIFIGFFMVNKYGLYGFLLGLRPQRGTTKIIRPCLTMLRPHHS